MVLQGAVQAIISVATSHNCFSNGSTSGKFHKSLAMLHITHDSIQLNEHDTYFNMMERV